MAARDTAPMVGRVVCGFKGATRNTRKSATHTCLGTLTSKGNWWDMSAGVRARGGAVIGHMCRQI